MVQASTILSATLPTALAASIIFDVPASVPVGAAKLDEAPIGISYEFFAFPSYRQNVSATAQCERNLKELSGTWPPVRIGGTTQDRALFDPALDAYVSYSVADPADAPADLTYGPRFFELAGEYEGRVTLGLNRGRNNLSNTIAAARAAVSAMPNLLALELGNEPEYYPKDGQPIASGTWDPATDAASQASWQISVANALDPSTQPIFEAGNSLEDPDTWGARSLIAAQNTSALATVQTYSHHSYPGGTLAELMSNANTVATMAAFKEDVDAAKEHGWEYVLGETNSATGGGAATVSPTFGAALWLASHALAATSANISRLYFHHGTVGACQYCWWGRYSMGAPYYGAYFAASLFSLGTHVTSLAVTGTGGDGGDAGDMAAYAVYGDAGTARGFAVLNSAFWDGSGERGVSEVLLRGLEGGKDVRVKRLTSESGGATARVDRGDKVTFGGLAFADGTCVISGEEAVEGVVVDGEGVARINVGASEGVLVLL